MPYRCALQRARAFTLISVNPLNWQHDRFSPEVPAIGVLVALEIITRGGMEEIGPAAGAPVVDEAGSAGALLQALHLTRGRTNHNLL